jgi:putative sterol carrier protein
MTVKDSFEEMKNHFNPEKAAGTTAVIQYIIKGDDGGAWYFTIKDGTCGVAEGSAENPDLTLELSGNDWLDIVAGKTTGVKLLMFGKLKMKGDTSLAMKVRSFFSS